MESNRTSVGDKSRFNEGVNKKGQRQETDNRVYTLYIYIIIDIINVY